MDMAAFLDAAVALLSVESTGDHPDELGRALDLVLAFIGPGFTVERFESRGKPSALVYHGTERPHFTVVLNAHLDVVPAPAGQFRPYRDGDRLYARGAQDMKVSALAQTLVFRELAGRVSYPLGLQLVTDEESGGRDGTLHQLREGVTSQFALIGESSGLRIVTECKGIVRARLQATGRSAHGIASVAFGIGGDGQHGPSEYADVTTIDPYRHALTAFLLDPTLPGPARPGPNRDDCREGPQLDGRVLVWCRSSVRISPGERV
jgi:acetylornithine deacetylase/succinyl-diaminopimelate desuccinylase-like protein